MGAESVLGADLRASPAQSGAAAGRTIAEYRTAQRGRPGAEQIRASAPGPGRLPGRFWIWNPRRYLAKAAQTDATARPVRWRLHACRNISRRECTSERPGPIY